MRKFDWEQINWFEADSKIVFDDTLGFIRVKTTLFYVLSTNGNQFNLNNCFYINNDDKKIMLNQSNYMDLFSHDIFLEQKFTPKIEASSLTIQGVLTRITNNTMYGANNGRNVTAQIERGNLPTSRSTVWMCEEIQNMPSQEILNLYQRPLFLNLQIGQSVFHKNLGKCTIVKIYEQPDMEDRMIDIQSENQEVRTIKFSSSDSDAVYKIPYQSPSTNESEQFNVCKNEFQLSPYMLTADKQINIYWQQIPNAARYIISLYKRDNRPYLQQIYPLKDYIVERSEGFLSIKDLLGSDYIAVVKAEDRSGEIIAKSRGIAVSGNKSYPQFWK